MKGSSWRRPGGSSEGRWRRAPTAWRRRDGGSCRLVRGGGESAHRRPERREGRDAADPARSAGPFRLYRRGGDPADRRGAQRVEGRDPRRRQLLPRFSPRARRRRRCSSSAAPNPARRWAARISSPISSVGHGLVADAHTAAASTSKPSIASAIARSRPPPCSTASRWRGSTRRRSTRSPPRGGRPMTRVYVPADSTALAVGADKVARAFRRSGRAARASTIDIVRTGSRGPILAGAAGRGRDARARARLWPARARTTPGRSRGFLAAAASQGARAGRGDRLAQAAAAPDLRALRRDRPAFARRLRRPRRPARACERVHRDRRRARR